MSGQPPADRSPAALAARAQLGDRESLEELLRRLQSPLHVHIRTITGDDDLAADALQETLLIICRRLGTVRQVEWIRAWAYRVATREALRAIRRSGRDRDVRLDDAPPLPDESGDTAGLEDEELLERLPAKLAALPPAARIVVRLRYLESLSQMEIAEALEIPIGTVKSRLAYGLEYLRRTWDPEGRA